MIKEEETTTLLLEIFEYFCQHKKLPENGIDMKLVLDEYYMKRSIECVGGKAHKRFRRT